MVWPDVDDVVLLQLPGSFLQHAAGVVELKIFDVVDVDEWGAGAIVMGE